MAETFIPSFELLADVKLNDCIPVKKYKSTLTGLTVVFGDIEGPIVSGKVVVVTEANDDDGLPHTLEHLISIGSEEYPYRGVLDLVTNRCLGHGTNAWTADDHTCYTVEIVGAEGFLRILPIFMDHILYPLLTDAAFVTEVHHITGEGNDGGVVYCEMQGRENDGDERMCVELMKGLCPDTGLSAYVGGRMKNLRESTTNEKIKEFHKKFYRPDNLTIVIAGQINPDDIFNALIPIEKKILSKTPLPPFERPWQTPFTPLNASKILEVQYPDDEETNGIAVIGYRGPKITTDQFDVIACETLLQYLTDTPTSPLSRDMVEIDEPYASSVCGCVGYYAESLPRVFFRNVPLKKMDDLFDKYKNILTKISNGEEPIDMKRMKEVIEKRIAGSLFDLETFPHFIFSVEIIIHAIYGDDSNFEEWLNHNTILKELLNENESFWINILQKYFIDAKFVCVKANPSIEEKQRLSTEDAARIEQRKDELGPEGLLKKAKILSDATESNHIPPPESMITNIPTSRTDTIAFYNVHIDRVTDENTITDIDLEQFPVYTELIDVHSNFINLILTIDTQHIPVKLRHYLRLFSELLGNSPIELNGEIIPHEKVVNQLEADTIYQGNSIGMYDGGNYFCGTFSNTLFFHIYVEPKKYHLAAKWFNNILNHTLFDKDRICVTANRLLNIAADIKRSGYSIVDAMMQAMFYETTSNVSLISIVKQQKFLNDILKKLEDEEGTQDIINDLTNLREMLMQGQNIGLHIATNWKKMISNEIDPITPFLDLIETKDKIKELQVVPETHFINPDGNLDEQSHGSILGMGAIESTYLYSGVPILCGYLDKDLPALILFCHYINQIEGPFFRIIRGQGYSYGYDIELITEKGLLTFNLYLSTNLLRAFKESKILLEKQCEEDAVWDQNLLQSARTSLIYGIVELEDSLHKVIKETILSSFKKVPVDYHKTLIKHIEEVTEEDLRKVGEKYIKLIFGEKTRIAVVCHPDKVKEIQSGFKELGYSLKIETSLETSILA